MGNKKPDYEGIFNFKIFLQEKPAKRTISPLKDCGDFLQSFASIRNRVLGNALADANEAEQDSKNVIPSIEGKSLLFEVLLDALHNIYYYFDKTKLANILIEILYKQDLLGEKSPITWYLEKSFQSIGDKPSKRGLRILIKSCSDCNLLTVRDKEGLLLDAPFFHKDIDPSTSAAEYYRDIAGLADTIFFLSPYINEITKDYQSGDLTNPQPRVKSQLRELLEWYEIEFQIIKFKDYEQTYDLNCKVIVKSYHNRPVDKNKEYIKLSQRDDDAALVASPHFRSALLELSKAWIYPRTKSILLSAWTGSGKEVLVDLLVNAIRINPDTHYISLSASEFGDFEGLSKRIVQELIGNKIINLVDQQYEYTIPDRLMIFFDEIHHKPFEHIRAGLLRLLSKDKLKLVNPNMVVTFKNPLYVFAASQPLNKLSLLEPIDLWTRIEHQIELRHPLMLEERYERREIIQQYFCLFCRKELSELIKDKKWPGRSLFLLDDRIDLNEQVLKDVSNKFAEILDSPLIPLLSIRMFGTMVKGILTNITMLLSTHPQRGEMDNIKELIYDSMDDWIFKMFKEMIPTEADPRGVF